MKISYHKLKNLISKTCSICYFFKYKVTQKKVFLKLDDLVFKTIPIDLQIKIYLQSNTLEAVIRFNHKQKIIFIYALLNDENTLIKLGSKYEELSIPK